MASARDLSLSDSSQKKQQTISSFFTPRAQPAKPKVAAPNTLPISSAPTTEASALAADKSDSPRPDSSTSTSLFVRADSSEGNEDAGPTVRRRRTPPKLSNEAEDDDDETSAVTAKRRKVSHGKPALSDGASIHEPEKLSGTRPPPRTEISKTSIPDRTSRYVYGSTATEDPEAADDDDEEIKKIKAKLHKKFVQKLGDPARLAEIRRKNGHIDEPGSQEDGEGAEDDDDEEDQASKPASKGKRKAAGPHKLTPMEKQVIEIKKQHQDTLLVVEVGYKYRFFGEDARVAAKELGILCIRGKMKIDEHFGPDDDRFASASFPTHRLHVHVRRLVAAGHKVGVVRQLETAALKKAGDNRNAPFVRKLTNLYTKGTYIDDGDDLDAHESTPGAGSPAAGSGTGYLLCLTETNATGWTSDEKVRVGIVAVQPGTGDVIYDDFEDGFMRGEIETRLLHIAPCEFLIVGQLSKATERLVKHLSASKVNVFGDRARVERVEKLKTAAAQSYSHISKFYSDKLRATSDSTSDGIGEKILDKVHKLSEHVSICLSSMINHLSDYGLEHVFDLTKNFQAFSARSYMFLNGNTLNSLEIYRNQTDNSAKGSLFWVLDQTTTKFGQRLLRKWVGRPLLDRSRLQERIDAVGELNDSGKSVHVEKLRKLLEKTKGDLEKSLIRIYYGKCSRSELLTSLQSLQRIATEYAHVKSPAHSGFDSPTLGEAVASLPLILDDVLSFLDKINPEAAWANDKEEFFRDEHATEAINAHKAGIAAIEADLDQHRSAAAAKLKKHSVNYVTVSGIDFLIEVENTNLKTVPASWAKISGTKKVSRFHTPDVVRLIRERDQHRESLGAACDAAFAALLNAVAAAYQTFRDCIQSLATLDCLLSLARVAARPGYVKPAFSDAAEIHVTAGRHPMVEQLLLSAYVANDVALSHEPGGTRGLLITGPNMGGKSSYVRQVALLSIMGQIGSYVPAAAARLGLLDAVFTRMGAHDNMLAGESTFMVELHETADTLRAAGPRSLVLLDELGRGTSTHDGVAIAHAVLDYLARNTQALLLFITHYQSLAAVAAGLPGMSNVHMSFAVETSPASKPTEASTSAKDSPAETSEIPEGAAADEDITFLYELAPGTAHRSYGLNVARRANLPRDVLDLARVKSAELEAAVRMARTAAAARALAGLVGGGASTQGLDVDALVAGIEQL